MLNNKLYLQYKIDKGLQDGKTVYMLPHNQGIP